MTQSLECSSRANWECCVNRFHPLHFRDEVNQFRVRVATYWQSIKKGNVKTTGLRLNRQERRLALGILTATVETPPCLGCRQFGPGRRKRPRQAICPIAIADEETPIA